MESRLIRTTTSSVPGRTIRSSNPQEGPPRKGFDSRLWDAYAPFFDLEEGGVFPVDSRELVFYSSLRAGLGGRCLEIGAGCGRLATALRGSGLAAGLEPSKAMLSRWHSEALSSMSRIRGLGQEMPLSPGAFNLVVFPYNGLHCLLDPGERKDLCREAACILAPGGWFVLETCPGFSRRPLEEDRERYSYEHEGTRYRLLESVRRDPSRRSITFYMRYYGGDLLLASLDLELALLDPADVMGLLGSCDLKIRHVWGDYDRSAFDQELSPRLLVVASGKDSR
jgi:SAM-dependent methyltransferase